MHLSVETEAPHTKGLDNPAAGTEHQLPVARPHPGGSCLKPASDPAAVRNTVLQDIKARHAASPPTIAG
jgi:hypothetical protein